MNLYFVLDSSIFTDRAHLVPDLLSLPVPFIMPFCAVQYLRQFEIQGHSALAQKASNALRLIQQYANSCKLTVGSPLPEGCSGEFGTGYEGQILEVTMHLNRTSDESAIYVPLTANPALQMLGQQFDLPVLDANDPFAYGKQQYAILDALRGIPWTGDAIDSIVPFWIDEPYEHLMLQVMPVWIIDDAQIVTYHFRIVDSNIKDMNRQRHPVLVLATDGPMWYDNDMQVAGVPYQFEVAQPGKSIRFRSSDGWSLAIKINRVVTQKPVVNVEPPDGLMGGLTKLVGGDFQRSFEKSYTASYRRTAEKHIKPYFTDLSFNVAVTHA